MSVIAARVIMSTSVQGKSENYMSEGPVAEAPVAGLSLLWL